MIGDLVGLSSAYAAAFSNNNDNNKKLKRKFFLQFARVACEMQRKDFAKLRLKTDPHSLGFAVVNEQVKHQKEFKNVYNCNPGDPMVIPEREIVKIW